MLVKHVLHSLGLALIGFGAVHLMPLAIIGGAAAVGFPLLLDRKPNAGKKRKPNAGKKRESEDDRWDRDHEFTGWHGEQVTALRRKVRQSEIGAWEYDHEVSMILASPVPYHRRLSGYDRPHTGRRLSSIPENTEYPPTLGSLDETQWRVEKARQTLADVEGETRAMEIDMYRKRVRELTDRANQRANDLLDAPVRACEVPSDGRHKVSDDPRDGLRLERRWA